VASPNAPGIATGFITNFFDTLGIGSFATTTAIFRKWGLARDERFTGTLNVGHTRRPIVPGVHLHHRLVPVDPKTLIC
jgi:hypothetical protein